MKIQAIMDDDEFQAMLRYQNMLSRQVLGDIKTSGKIKLLEVVNDLTNFGKKRVQTATVLHEAEDRGMLESDVYAVFDELVKDRLIEEKDGYVKKL